MLTRERSTALLPLDISQPTPKKWRLGCPSKKRAIDPILPLPEAADIVAEDLNESLSTLYRVRRCRQQPTLAIPQLEAPHEPEPFSKNKTALKQIHTHNLQDNVDLTHRTTPTRPTNANSIPEVIETLQSVNMDKHFPCLHPLSIQ